MFQFERASQTTCERFEQIETRLDCRAIQRLCVLAAMVCPFWWAIPIYTGYHGFRVVSQVKKELEVSRLVILGVSERKTLQALHQEFCVGWKIHRCAHFQRPNVALELLHRAHSIESAAGRLPSLKMFSHPSRCPFLLPAGLHSCETTHGAHEIFK